MTDVDHKQALPSGFDLEAFRLLEVLGVGGFGVTYLAHDPKLDRRIAIKEYLPNEFAVREGTTVLPKSRGDREDFAWGLARFLDEARTLARFRHPNLVRVVEYFEANRTAYIVMDYEDGEPLDRLLDRHGTLSEGQLKRVLLPLVEGLEQVHAAGYLHRDIKPSNVFVRRTDESPVLLDFGAARQALGRKSKSLTAVASAGYSPPEQYESEGEQGPWTDVYALSALCYRAITGDVPVEAPRRQSRLLRGQPDPQPKLTDLAPAGYSRPLLEAVDAGLRVVETERPASLAQWTAELEGRPIGGRRSAEPSPGILAADTARPASRRGSRAAGLGIAAAVMVAAAGVGFWYWSQAGPGPESVRTGQEGAAAPVEPGAAQHAAPLGGGSAILVVETAPPGAEVTIAGAVAGTTPLQVRDVRSGIHPVTLRHPHYDTVLLGDQTFADGEVLRIERTLTRATGKLTVLTEPAEAWIERDGARLGEGTPVTLEGLPAGPLELTLGALEHETIRVQVEVPKDGVGTLERTLRQIPHGTLTLDLDPPEATVTLPDVAPAYRPGMRLPEGEHRVTVRSVGYREVTQSVVVSGDTRATIALALDPQPFTVVTTPPQAVVELVGTGLAYAPGVRLPPGAYTVRVSAEGYVTQEERVRHRDEPTRVAVTLETAIPQPGETFSDSLASGGEGPRMVVIPAGSFRMGCVTGRDCDDDEHPVHTVRLAAPFALSVHEVTFADWEACTSAGGCSRHRPDDEGWGRGNRPVINVSWEDAQSYVSWLSRETGAAYRLPSESEWEYSARAGTVTSYGWANEIGRNRANCDGCGSRWDDDRTAPVGSFAANSWGLYDMHGNVWEWVEDCWNGSYRGAPLDGSAWPQGNCSERVLRGGSWFDYPGLLRSAFRFRNAPGSRSSYVGFRVARTLTP